MTYGVMVRGVHSTKDGFQMTKTMPPSAASKLEHQSQPLNFFIDEGLNPIQPELSLNQTKDGNFMLPSKVGSFILCKRSVEASYIPNSYNH